MTFGKRVRILNYKVTFEEFVESLGYSKAAIARMTHENIMWLRERWIKQREGKE